jgi:hypothetical protein
MNKAKPKITTSDLYNYTIDPTIPYKITNYTPKIYEERRKYNSETGLENKVINANDTNLLLTRDASGLLDNIISNKYNGIKNIIKLSPIKLKSTTEVADHIGIIFDIVIDEGKFKYDYEKDPTEARRQLQTLYDNNKQSLKQTDIGQLKTRIKNVELNMNYENIFKFRSNPLSKPSINSGVKNLTEADLKKDYIFANVGHYPSYGGKNYHRYWDYSVFFVENQVPLISNKIYICKLCYDLYRKIHLFSIGLRNGGTNTQGLIDTHYKLMHTNDLPYDELKNNKWKATENYYIYSNGNKNYLV